jgi:ATP-binding cassette subfamily B protein
MIYNYICVKQQYINDCGAACISTVSKTYGLPTPLSKIKEIACVDSKEINVFGLVKAARRLGFNATSLQCSIDELYKNQLPIPFIAFVDNGSITPHYVVIHEVNSETGKVVIADPATCIKELTRDELENIWRGIAISMTPYLYIDNQKVNKVV